MEQTTQTSSTAFWPPRGWHARTGRGPADHPLLKPDPPYWGFRDLTQDEAKALDAERLRALRTAAQPEQAA